MNEDVNILLFLILSHWVILFVYYLKSESVQLLVINLSIQAIYSSCFLYGLFFGESSSVLAYYMCFLFFVFIHLFVNTVQFVILYSKKKGEIDEFVDIYDWVKFWDNYDQLIIMQDNKAQENELVLFKNVVNGTAEGWARFRQSFLGWAIKQQNNLTDVEEVLIKKLVKELVLKTDIIFNKEIAH